MYKKSLIIFLYLLFIFFIPFKLLFGQENIKFKHLTIDDGLTQNAVFTILQDTRGFMWFGTKDGLNRYDGYSFQAFYHNPFDSTSISANYITTIFEDSRGLIWIGTLDKGISIYQHKTGKFKSLDLNVSVGDFTNSGISSIVEDHDANIWIGTRGNGLFRLKLFDKTTLSFSKEHYFGQSDSLSSLSNNDITSLLVDSTGKLWIGTVDELNYFRHSDEKFGHLAISTKNDKAITQPLENGITSIYESKEGELWLGTLSGVVLFNRESEKYKLYPHKYNIFRFGWGIINSIMEDDFGQLWLATASELMRFDQLVTNHN